MSVIPDFVIEDWKKQYAPESELWQKYPEVDRKRVLEAVKQDDIALKAKLLNANCLNSQNTSPTYVATAGAPLAGKSTILEQYFGSDLDNMVRIDPDQWGMRFMVETYIDYLMSSSMLAGVDYPYAQRRAYDIARPASNFITLEVLNEAVNSAADIVHGTTMTSPHIGGLLSGLKDRGYNINLFLCAATNDVRAKGQEYRSRDQGYYQSTLEDVRQKGKEFPKRMEDYLKYGDIIEVFWRYDVTSDAEHAASFTEGDLTIHSKKAFAHFVNQYTANRAALMRQGTELPSFNDIRRGYENHTLG